MSQQKPGFVWYTYITCYSKEMYQKFLYSGVLFLFRSVQNSAECHLVVALLSMLGKKNVPPHCIGIITPYKAQEKRIKALIKKE